MTKTGEGIYVKTTIKNTNTLKLDMYNVIFVVTENDLIHLKNFVAFVKEKFRCG